jgi:hypothetical protein
MTEPTKWLTALGALVLFGGLCYTLGRSHAEVRFVREQGEERVKEIEVIKYVTRKKEKIWAQPHDGRDTLLDLMRAGRL